MHSTHAPLSADKQNCSSLVYIEEVSGQATPLASSWEGYLETPLAAVRSPTEMKDLSYNATFLLLFSLTRSIVT